VPFICFAQDKKITYVQKQRYIGILCPYTYTQKIAEVAKSFERRKGSKKTREPEKGLSILLDLGTD
jgi:hypothetical protein